MERLSCRWGPLAIGVAILLPAFVLQLASGQYFSIEKIIPTPHLVARLPQLPPRAYPGGVVARISAVYEVDTMDFERMQKDIMKRLSAALEDVPLQYFTMNSFQWLTAGALCRPESLICKGEDGTGPGMLAPGIGGALPGAYSGSLSAADPRQCSAADGQVVPDNPTTIITGEIPPSEFNPQWNEEDAEEGPKELDRLVNSMQLCVHKSNTSLQYYPVVLGNVFVTGVRDNDNTRVFRNQATDPNEKIDLELHVVGVIPITWAKFLNRKLVLNGSIPLPLYQPEVVDKDAVATEDINVTLPILAVRKLARHMDNGGDVLEYDMPVCKDPNIAAQGCVRITFDYYYHPKVPEYKLRSYVEWRKFNFTVMASDQPHPEGAFNVSQGPWAVVDWVGPREEEVPGPWSQRTFPQKGSVFQEDCQTGNECEQIPTAPPLRHLHSAVLYKTWTFEDQALTYLCNERPGCNEDCLTNLTCLGGVSYFQDNFFFRSTKFRNDDGGIVPIYTLQHQDCPRNCCNDRRLCMRTHDVMGYEIPFNAEMMLVFGGKGYVHEKDPETGRLIYHDCERIPKTKLRKEWRSCHEIVLNDLWRYDIVRGKWEYLKPDSATSATTGEPVGYPLPRYGHGAVVVEQVEGMDDSFKRYFMYIYGGLGPQCSAGGICTDVWKYEIPFAAQAYYPKFPDGEWIRGNQWTRLKDCPFGGRYRHAMVVTSGMEYIYSYGGQVLGEFTNILMRYRISTDMWEDLDPFGRISLTRMSYDYRGQQVIREVPLDWYSRDVDVDCANAWRFDGKWAHCSICADCRLKTGTRDKGAHLPEERGDTMLVAFADHTPGAVDDTVAMFGGYRTTWGTNRDPEAECAAITTTTTTTYVEMVMGEDVVLTDAPLTTPLPTTTTVPVESGIELIGMFPRLGPTDPPSTTTTTFGWTTTKTTTEILIAETYTSTTTTTVTTRTSTTSTTMTTTSSTMTGSTSTTLPGPQTFPAVVSGSIKKTGNLSELGDFGAPITEDSVARFGPEVCTSKYYFDDLWLYEATTNQFFQHSVHGNLPMARRGHGMIARRFTSNDTQLVLFGGHNQDKPSNDMWILNVMRDIKERRWERIDPYFEGRKPPTMAYHSMLYSERLKLMIVFGGLHWKETDLQRSDALRNIDRRCLKKAQGMVEEEAGTSEADFMKMMRRACAETQFCCHIANYTTPPVYHEGTRIRTPEGALNLTAISMLCREECQEKAFFPEFYPIMSEGVWAFKTNRCPGNCSNHGYCDMSQCVCEPDYYGIDCSQQRCPGSPCYTDPRTKEQFCVDCSNHGRCINGECQCFPGWGFDDCSVAICEDNCSSTPLDSRGVCAEDFPVHQCVCFGRYSGRKCENLLCLNGCSGRGTCQPDGTCQCHAGFHGVDCSLWTLRIK